MGEPLSLRVARFALLVVVAAAGVVLWVGTLMAVIDGIGSDVADLDHGRDLRAFSIAGSLALDGDVDGLYDHDNPAYEGAATFVNPPWYALVMIPLSRVPFDVLWPLWTIAGIGSLFLALRGLGVDEWGRAGSGVMLTVSAVFAVYFGQNSFFMVALLAMVLSSIAGGRRFGAGLGLALLGFKPHLFIGFAVLAFSDLRRWWRTAVGAMAVTAFLMVVSALALPGSWAAFLDALGDPGSLVDPHREVSLVAGVRLMFGGDGPIAIGASVVAAIGVALGFAVRARRVTEDASLLPLTVVVSLLIAPHALAYDWLLLVPACAILWVTSAMDRQDLLTWALVLAFAVAVGPRLSEAQLDVIGAAVHLPAIALALFGWKLWTRLDDKPVRAEPS